MEYIVINFGVIYIIALLLVFIAFRRLLYSILDPAIWLIPTLASMLTLSFNSNIFLYVLLSVIALWCGMVIVTKGSIKRNFRECQHCNFITLEVFTYIIYIVYTLSVLYTFFTGGIPLFSDLPSEAKITVFEGNGLVRRISFLGGIIPINVCLMIFLKPEKRFYIILLLFYCILKILMGSKSSIIGLVFPLYYFLTQKNLGNIKISKKQIKKYIFIAGCVAIMVLCVIVGKEAESENSTLLFSLGYRLMEFGDVMLYYSSDEVRNAFSNFSAFQFFSDEMNGIFGMLRLTEYKEPLGFMMVKAYNPFTEFATTVGPNALFTVKGHIYFGFTGGIIYSFIIGMVFAWVRNYFFKMEIKDVFYYSMIAYVFFSCMGIVRESGGYISNLFDYVFFTTPILFFSQIIIKIYARRKDKQILRNHYCDSGLQCSK